MLRALSLVVVAAVLAAGCSKKDGDSQPAAKPESAGVAEGDARPETASAAAADAAPTAAEGVQAFGLENVNEDLFDTVEVGSNTLLLFAAADEDETLNAALFSGKPGSYKRLWEKRPLLEKAGVLEYGMEAPVVAIADGRSAILWVNPYQGCGDESCTPEDDYTTSTLIEIAADGPRTLWSMHGPSCATTRPAHPGPSCFIELEPGKLAVTVETKTERFVLEGGAYKPAR